MICVRIANLLTENDLNSEERKRSINQRKVNETYKKNASYVQASQNPLFEVLENLLSGKTEKEVHSKSSLSSELQNKVESESSVDHPVNSIPEFEQGKKIYFSPTIPFHQNIQNVVSDKTQIQQTTSQVNGELEVEEGLVSFHDEPLDVFIPERFKNDFTRTTNEDSIFGKNLEQLLFERTFNKAKKSYSYQMQMAQDGFTIPESKFSLTA